VTAGPPSQFFGVSQGREEVELRRQELPFVLRLDFDQMASVLFADLESKDPHGLKIQGRGRSNAVLQTFFAALKLKVYNSPLTFLKRKFDFLSQNMTFLNNILGTSRVFHKSTEKFSK
jgi:hypothetical protein